MRNRESLDLGLAGACWFCDAVLRSGFKRWLEHGHWQHEPYTEVRRVRVERFARNDNAAPRMRRPLRVDACASCSSRKGRRDVDWLRERLGGGLGHLFAGELGARLERAERFGGVGEDELALIAQIERALLAESDGDSIAERA